MLNSKLRLVGFRMQVYDLWHCDSGDRRLEKVLLSFSDLHIWGDKLTETQPDLVFVFILDMDSHPLSS